MHRKSLDIRAVITISCQDRTRLYQEQWLRLTFLRFRQGCSSLSGVNGIGRQKDRGAGV
jgi:hypothetical protein